MNGQQELSVLPTLWVVGIRIRIKITIRKKAISLPIKNLAMVEHVAWVPCGFDREQSGIILTWEKVKVNTDSFNKKHLLIPTPSENISGIIKDTYYTPMVNGHDY